MPSSVFAAVRARQPLIHAITNPVTMNDVVNMILASGALAICADNPEETREITLLSDGLLLNTGMPCDEKLRAMIRAGRAANENGIPVVLDPVGAGASQYRKRFLKELLRQVRVDCVRANRSETAALCGVSFEARGVESADVSADTDSIRRLSEKLDAVIAVTGEEDLAVYKETVLKSRTGCAMQKRITGAGCMLGGLIAAAIAGNRTSPSSKGAPRMYWPCTKCCRRMAKRRKLHRSACCRIKRQGRHRLKPFSSMRSAGWSKRRCSRSAVKPLRHGVAAAMGRRFRRMAAQAPQKSGKDLCYEIQ